MKTSGKDRVKALIIDDEADVCFLLGSILRNRNLQTSFVNSITEAKQALQKDIPSIVFLDNHLPDGFGVNFIGEIKKFDPSIKIVMITAHDTTSDKANAYREGADYFIGKPFTKDNIFNAIERL